MSSLLLHQTRVRRWVGISCSGLVGLFAWSTVVLHKLVGYDKSWSCGEDAADFIVLTVMWIGGALAVFDLVRNVTRDKTLCSRSPVSTALCDFLLIVLLTSLGTNRLRKTFGGKFMIGRKKDYLRINFYLLRTFCPHLVSFCVVSSFTTFQPNFTSGLLQVIYRDLG